MGWTTKLPTKAGWWWWRKDDKSDWEVREAFDDDCDVLKVSCVDDYGDEFFISTEEYGGEWLEEVPTPGTTYTVKEIIRYKAYCEQNKFDFYQYITSPIYGIKTITERANKWQTAIAGRLMK